MLRTMSIALLWVSVGLAAEPLAPGSSVSEPSLFSMKPISIQEDDDELLRLLKERHNAALRKLQADYAEMKLGFAISVDQLIDGARRVLNSKLEICKSQSERIAGVKRGQVHINESVMSLTAWLCFRRLGWSSSVAERGL